VAKLVRLVAIYSYFAFALAAPMTRHTAEAVGRMIAQQQAILGGPEPPPMDSTPLAQAYMPMYETVPAAMIVLGSIYPAIALYVLVRAREARAVKAAPDALLNEVP
jgi:hypothetical protein